MQRQAAKNKNNLHHSRNSLNLNYKGCLWHSIQIHTISGLDLDLWKVVDMLISSYLQQKCATGITQPYGP